MRAARVVFMWLERAFLVGLVLQLFFIGFGVFPRGIGVFLRGVAWARLCCRICCRFARAGR